MKVFLILALIFAVSFAQYPSCQFSLNGVSYDLSALRTEQDYHVSGQQFEFTMNLCGPIASSFLRNQFPNSSAVMSAGQNYYSLGDASTVQWASGGNQTNPLIVASFTGGENNSKI